MSRSSTWIAVIGLSMGVVVAALYTAQFMFEHMDDFFVAINEPTVEDVDSSGIGETATHSEDPVELYDVEVDEVVDTKVVAEDQTPTIYTDSMYTAVASPVLSLYGFGTFWHGSFVPVATFTHDTVIAARSMIVNQGDAATHAWKLTCTTDTGITVVSSWQQPIAAGARAFGVCDMGMLPRGEHTITFMYEETSGRTLYERGQVTVR